MYKITICIPTYKRPVLLKKLILSISECSLNKSLINDINILVVDNDIDLSAKTVVDELKLRFFDKFEIHYFDFPVKGLSNVRNELLRKAIELHPDFIVFIDDDEYPMSEWLNELVEAIIINNGDMVMGPVISVFESRVSKYISCWFERPNHNDNTIINAIATGNLIIKTDTLLKYKIWFDPRFNNTGAEDSYFGQQMFNQGAKAYWAAKAIVYETVTKDRTTLSWLVKRNYNAANTYTYILKLEKQFIKIIKKSIISMLYIIIGFCAFVLLFFPFKLRYWGIIKLSEGIGGVAGLLSLHYNEYR